MVAVKLMPFISDYVENLRLNFVSEDTIIRKERFLVEWFVKEKMSVEANSYQIKDKLLHLCKGLGVPQKGFNDRLSHLRQFYRYLIELQKYKGRNEALLVGRTKVPRNIREPFDDDEVQKIIICPPLPRATEQDNDTYRLMIQTYCALGCRCSDLLKLKQKDLHISPELCYVTFRKTKSGNDAQLSIPIELAYKIQKNMFKYHFKEYVFENRYGRKVSQDGIQEAFKRRLNYLGILPNGRNIHSLRHSRATRLDDKDVGEAKISKLLYHESIETTMRYIHASPKKLHMASLNDPIYAALN